MIINMMKFTSRLAHAAGLLFFLTFPFGLLSASMGTSSVHGMITANGFPISGVSVLIEQLQIGTVTDHHGHYDIHDLPSGEFSLAISFIGYETVFKHIQFDGSDLHLDIQLQQTFIERQAVTITGSSQPTSRLMSNRVVEGLNPNDMMHSQGRSMGEALESIPGVQSLSQGPAVSKPVIRGLTNNRIVIVEDGVRHEAQQWGDHHTPELEMDEASRVEVLRGPSSLLFGSGAIGGVINIVKEDLPSIESGTSPFSSHLNLRTGTNAAEFGGDWHFQGAAPRLGWELVLGMGSAEEFSAPDDDQFLVKIENTGFTSEVISGRLQYYAPKGKFQLGFSDYHEEQVLIGQGHWHNTGGGSDGTEPWFHQGGAIKSPTHHQKLQLGWNLQKNAHRFEIVTAVQTDHREGIPEDMPSAVDLESRIWSLDGRWSGIAADRSPFTLGISAGTKENRTFGTEVLLPNHNSREWALFWHQRYQILTDVNLSAGLRSDWNNLDVFRTEMTPGDLVEPETKKYHGIVSGGLGIVWHPESTPYSLAFNLGSGFRTPTPVELYINGIHHAANRYELGDPDLDVENSLSLEFIARWITANTDIEATVFQNNIYEFIFTNPTGSMMTTTLGAQIPLYQIDQSDARMQGFEVSFQHRIIGLMRLEGSYEMIRSKILDSMEDADGDGKTEQHLPFQPADHIGLGITFCAGDYSIMEELHLSIELDHYFEQDRLAEFENVIDVIQDVEFTSKSYTLWKVSVNTDLHLFDRHTRLHASVLNLTNQKYTSHLSNYKGIATNPGLDIRLNLEIPLIN